MQAPTTFPSSAQEGSSQRHGKSWGFLLIALLLCLSPVSCGDEKKSSGDSGASVDFSSLRDDAEAARDAAKEAGAEKFASAEFEKGLDYLAKAEDYEAEQPSKAKARYRSSKNKFEEALEKTEKNQSKLASLEEDMKKYETIRDRLKEAGAEALVTDAFQKAEDDFAGAKGAVDKGDMKDAQRKLRYAMSAISTAEKQLARLNTTQATADEERAQMEKEKAAAEAETANVLAESDFKYASDLERDAIAAYDKNDFSTAINLFRNARYTFEGAAKFARDKKALATSDRNPNPGGGIARREGGNNSGEAPDVGEIEKPDFVDSLDMSDLPSLFKGIAQFDEQNRFGISWTSGYEFQQDAKVYAGRLGGSKANIIYEGSAGVAEGATDYVFSGNTIGHILVDCKFRDMATMRANVHFLLLGPKATFELVIMSDDGEKFYASEFGTNIFTVEGGGRYKKPKARASQPAYRKPFSSWVQKREPYELVFTYFKPDDETKGVLICKLDGEETARFETDQIRSGKIGFRWSQTKFIVKDLEIKGGVDEEWAKERLESASTSGGDAGGGGADDIGF